MKIAFYILLCLLAPAAWGQTIFLTWGGDTNATNCAVEYSGDGLAWHTVAQAPGMTNALLPAYQVNTNGYWTNQLVNPIWVADCSIHNFYRVRYDYPGAGYWVPGSYSTFPKDQWENHGPYFSVYSPPNRQLKIVIVP